jgi:hypothetical protein
MLSWRFLARALREVAMSGQFDTKFERVKQSCMDLASQTRCPRHYKDAKVEIAGESLDGFSMELVTCVRSSREPAAKATWWTAGVAR